MVADIVDRALVGYSLRQSQLLLQLLREDFQFLLFFLRASIFTQLLELFESRVKVEKILTEQVLQVSFVLFHVLHLSKLPEHLSEPQIVVRSLTHGLHTRIHRGCLLQFNTLANVVAESFPLREQPGQPLAHDLVRCFELV